MKKFYKLVSVAPAGDGFSIQLDGKPVKTPSGAMLSVPTQALADNVVQEWAGQDEDIIPDSMPLTQLLTTQQDLVSAARTEMSERLLPYLDTDLICYRADDPQALAERQKQAWDPWIEWFEGKYGARLETTTGLAALTQPEKAHEQARNIVETMDEHAFTVLQMVVPLVGSLVLALAFVAGEAAPEQLYDAAHVEENYKAEIYNEAEHGSAPLQEKKQAAMKRDLIAARKFLDLLKL